MISSWSGTMMRWVATGVLLFAATVVWSADNALFSATQTRLNPDNDSFLQQPSTQAIHIMTVHPELIAEDTTDIQLEVEPGKILAAYRTGFTLNSDGIASWEGAINLAGNPSPDDKLLNQVILVRHGDNITGSINYNGQLYQVLPLGEGNHAIIKTDSDRLPWDEKDEVAPPGASEIAPSAPPFGQPGTLSGLTKIRVMVATTNQTRAQLKDVAGKVQEAIDDANAGYRNSDIAIELENAGILNVNYNEKGANLDMLGQLRNTSDTELGAVVHKFRQEQLADVVVLLKSSTTAAASSCGIGYTLAGSDRSWAFSVVAHNCISSHAFAHEIGHNLGATHNPENTTLTYFPYGYGYRQTAQTPRWRTIMSYPCTPPCGIINMWSNPNKQYLHLPAGTASKNDNARLLNERKEIVANFYPPPSHWLQVGELLSNSDLPARQFFEVQLKDSASNQVLSAFDSVASTGQLEWPMRLAESINSHFPENVVRAGEMDSNGDIRVAEWSGDKNKLWLYHTLAGQRQLQITRYSYAQENNEKWFTIGSIEGLEDATPGTQKQVVLRDKASQQELARISMPITSSNNGRYMWPYHLSNVVNSTAPLVIRAGEMKDDGSIVPVVGSYYRNRLWVPLAQRRQLTVAVETVAAPPVTPPPEEPEVTPPPPTPEEPVTPPPTPEEPVTPPPTPEEPVTPPPTPEEPVTPPQYDYRYPDQKEKYVEGTRVLGSDQHIYRCKPFPYSGWCRIYSPSANHYEPGAGSHWQDAWTRVE
ncbi:M12 family metallo-peptidase [Pantoea sp. B65]|uniref:M12 family metallo-peptidase n=1 Tax=Pantoea sp. B65 TaxID=2813359 RepID=UPI0039B69FB2